MKNDEGAQAESEYLKLVKAGYDAAQSGLPWDVVRELVKEAEEKVDVDQSK